MNHIRSIHLSRVARLVTLAVCAGVLLSACRTTAPNYRQAERTGDRITAFRDEAINIQKAIDATAAALDELVDKAHVDPRGPFRQFGRAVEGVEKAHQASVRRADDMRAEGKVFFEQWQKEIATVNNPEVRQLAEERKATLEKTFRDISRVTVEARDDLRPWLNNVRDLQTLLGNDLTIAGIDSARSLIAKTKTEGAKVKLSFDTLIDELNSVTAAITPARGTLQ
jgi:hypothetical protein